jgi:hypothetical protein
MVRWVAVAMLGACYAPTFSTGAPCTSDADCPNAQVCAVDRCELACPSCDAGIDQAPATCWDRWLSGDLAFAEPVVLDAIRAPLGGNTFNPTLDADLLVIRVAQDNGTDLELLRANRETPTAAFGPLREIEELNTARDESKVSVTGDGLVAVFASTRVDGLGLVDLWQASRTTVAAPFDPASASAFIAINDAFAQFDPELTPDGLHLYYAPTKDNEQLIRHASRSAVTVAFGPPEVVDVGFATAFDPTISPDRRVLVFTVTDRDLYYTTRADPEGAFGPAIALPFNSPASDGDADLAADGCSLVFGSNRGGAKIDVYLATMKR